MRNWMTAAPLLKAGCAALLAWLATGASPLGAVATLAEMPVWSGVQESEPAPAVEQTGEQAGGEQAGGEQPGNEPPVAARPRFIADASARIADHDGDVFFAGQSASIVGEVGHNAGIFAQGANVDGVVRGDLFSWAGSVTISGEIYGDVYAGTGSLIVMDGAVIHGNLMCFCGSMRLDGTVRGTLLGSVGTGGIDGVVGSLDLETGSLAIGAGAEIRGDVEYRSNDEIEIDPAATVRGEVRRNVDEDDDEEEVSGGDESIIGRLGLLWKAWSFASSFVIGAVLLLFGGTGARRPAECLLRQPAPGLGFGFVVAVVFPVACLLAFVPIITLPLGLMGLVVFGLTLVVARLVAAHFLGSWLMRMVGRSRPSPYLALALGLLALMLIGLIPYLGFLVRMAAVILGIGGIYLALRDSGFPAFTSADGPGAALPSPTEAA